MFGLLKLLKNLALMAKNVPKLIPILASLFGPDIINKIATKLVENQSGFGEREDAFTNFGSGVTNPRLKSKIDAAKASAPTNEDIIKEQTKQLEQQLTPTLGASLGPITALFGIPFFIMELIKFLGSGDTIDLDTEEGEYGLEEDEGKWDGIGNSTTPNTDPTGFRFSSFPATVFGPIGDLIPPNQVNFTVVDGTAPYTWRLTGPDIGSIESPLYTETIGDGESAYLAGTYPIPGGSYIITVQVTDAEQRQRTKDLDITSTGEEGEPGFDDSDGNTNGEQGGGTLPSIDGNDPVVGEKGGSASGGEKTGEGGGIAAE